MILSHAMMQFSKVVACFHTYQELHQSINKELLQKTFQSTMPLQYFVNEFFGLKEKTMIAVSMALLADCANISREGKLNILGIFNRINAQSLPVMHPQMQLVMTLEADRGDADKEHRMEIELIDADGVKLFSIVGDLKFAPPPPGEQIRINHIIQVNNLKFDRFGNYDFKIIINNEVRQSVTISVLEVRQP